MLDDMTSCEFQEGIEIRSMFNAYAPAPTLSTISLKKLYSCNENGTINNFNDRLLGTVAKCLCKSAYYLYDSQIA